MVSPDGPASFSDLVDRVRQGDATAISELIANYEEDVRLVARARLGPALQPYVDSVDLLQSVHKSLLAGL